MKERLDKYLTDLGYFETKSKAAAAILAGHVKINDEYITKAGFQINPAKEYEIVVKSMPYVSRGGFKLKKALDTFPIKIDGRICLDAGASTGGFTDCLLQNGAKFVYAADVGYGQLDWKIRSDSRVKTIERTNLKNCAFEEIYSEGETIADLLVSDLSFISLTKVLPNLKNLLAPDFHEMILLIKPQFEAGKEQVGKNGVVREKETHIEVIEKVINYCKNLGLYVKGLTFSPIKGPKGNIEYLVYLTNKEIEQVYVPSFDYTIDALSADIDRLIGYFKNSRKKNSELSVCMSQVDLKLVDMAHFIEFGTFDEQQRLEQFSSLQNAYKVRRKIKDNFEITKCAAEMPPAVLEGLESMKSTIDRLKNRKYTQRAKDDIIFVEV